MMGEMDTRNMQSDFAVNKYLHTVGSYWILLMQSHDARNREYKIKHGLGAVDLTNSLTVKSQCHCFKHCKGMEAGR